MHSTGVFQGTPSTHRSITMIQEILQIELRLRKYLFEDLCHGRYTSEVVSLQCRQLPQG